MFHFGSMRFVSTAATLAALAAGGAATPAVATAPDGAVAHAAACTRARIGGRTVCLAVGQTCKRRYEAQYRRKGFTCARKAGTYRLKRQAQSF